MRKPILFTILIAIMTATSGAMAAQNKQEVVRFGVQNWPGVTVKTEVATLLLEAMGYKTEQVTMGTPIIVQGLSDGSLDAGFGGWYPISARTIDPAVEAGKIDKLVANITGALSGVAVPTYVHDAGVTSVADLEKHGDRFDRKIYGIESGAEWNTGFQELIDADRYGLGDWRIISSSSSGMLAQVERATKRDEWVVFYGWKPHWMNFKYDISYLDARADKEIAKTESTVYTLTPKNLSSDRPNVARFFKQYVVPVKVQSEWVYEYGYKDRSEREVAREWIRSNPGIFRRWVDGVSDVNGNPAYPAIKTEYDMQ